MRDWCRLLDVDADVGVGDMTTTGVVDGVLCTYVARTYTHKAHEHGCTWNQRVSKLIYKGFPKCYC